DMKKLIPLLPLFCFYLWVTAQPSSFMQELGYQNQVFYDCFINSEDEIVLSFFNFDRTSFVSKIHVIENYQPDLIDQKMKEITIQQFSRLLNYGKQFSNLLEKSDFYSTLFGGGTTDCVGGFLYINLETGLGWNFCDKREDSYRRRKVFTVDESKTSHIFDQKEGVAVLPFKYFKISANGEIRISKQFFLSTI